MYYTIRFLQNAIILCRFLPFIQMRLSNLHNQVVEPLFFVRLEFYDPGGWQRLYYHICDHFRSTSIFAWEFDRA